MSNESKEKKKSIFEKFSLGSLKKCKAENIQLKKQIKELEEQKREYYYQLHSEREIVTIGLINLMNKIDPPVSFERSEHLFKESLIDIKRQRKTRKKGDKQ